MGHDAVTPHRVVQPARRHWRPLAIGAVLGAVILVALVLAAFAVVGRANDLNEAIYEQCVRDEVQDAVIAAQLRAAKVRVNATLPPGSPERRYQLEVLNDGIAALEPPDESPCKPPEGVEP